MADPSGAIAGAFGIFTILFFFFWFVMMAVMVAGFILWILMIIDVVKRKFPQENDKIMWILIVVLTGIIGALVYYFVVKRKAKK